MSKKDKKIEIQLVDAVITVDGKKIEGVELISGKKKIGEIVELENSFASVKNEGIDSLYKSLDEAVHALIQNFNLNN